MNKIILALLFSFGLNFSFAQEVHRTQENKESLRRLIMKAPGEQVILISKVNKYETELFLEKAQNFINSVRGISRYQAKVSFIPSWSVNMRNLERIILTEGQSLNHERARLYKNYLKDWLNRLIIDELSAILNKPIRWIDGVVVIPYPVTGQDRDWLIELSKAYDFKIYIQKE